MELLGRVGAVPKEFNNEESGKRLVSFPMGTDVVYRSKDDSGFGESAKTRDVLFSPTPHAQQAVK